MLSDSRIERYSRQILLPRVGGRGQESIFAASVEVVGDGIVARTAARYLCAAGVGRLAVRAGSDASADQQSWELYNPDCTVNFESTAYDAGVNLLLHAGCGHAGADPDHAPVDHRCVRRLVGMSGRGHASVTDLGRSCAPCAVAAFSIGEALPTGTSRPLDEVAERVTGTLLAQEALALLLDPGRPEGRAITIGVIDATAESLQLKPAPKCPHAAAAGDC